MDYYDNFIGKMLDDRYEILERIGTGGMAVVYKARCHRLNRLVAIKILKAELAQDEEFRERFHAESQAVAMLSHTNIVGVYDVSHSDNIDYIVMELIEGITLKQYINRKGLLNWKEALHFSIQIARALSHAHSRGIIHRDIKPHNIMVLKDGSVKVADFGIARLLSSQNTLTRNALGSVHYISPEQAKGGHVDARTDLYSLGVVMYEMLTNRLPFEGDSAVAIAIQHINSIPLLPSDINPDIPLGIEEIIMHAMDPDVDLRYASADEMIRDMEMFRQDPDTVFGYGTTAHERQNGLEGTKVIPTDAVSASVKERKKTERPKKTQPAKTSRVQKQRDYGSERRRAGQTSFLIGVFCSVIFIMVLFVFLWNNLLKDMFNPSDERIDVPSFEGKYVYDVIDSAEYKNQFVFEVSYEPSKTVEENYIVSQSPSADRQVVKTDKGVKINLVVSRGDNGSIMPDILNKDYRDAKTMLESYDLDLNIVLQHKYSDTVTSGYVMEQQPEKGTDLAEGMDIYITYSVGPEKYMTTVPDVVGKSESQAKEALEQKDLTYATEYIDGKEAAGTVISQNINEGTEVEVGSKVTLYISNGTQSNSGN